MEPKNSKSISIIAIVAILMFTLGLLNYDPDGTIYEANFGFFVTFVTGSIYLVGKLIDAMNKNS